MPQTCKAAHINSVAALKVCTYENLVRCAGGLVSSLSASITGAESSTPLAQFCESLECACNGSALGVGIALYM